MWRALLNVPARCPHVHFAAEKCINFGIASIGLSSKTYIGLIVDAVDASYRRVQIKVSG